MMKGEKNYLDDVGVLIKLVGSLLILIGSVSYGILYGRELEKNYQEYESIKQILIGLERNCQYGGQSYPEFFASVSQQMNHSPIVCAAIQSLANRMPSEPVEKAWQHFVDEIHMKIRIPMQLVQSLAQLGMTLSGMDLTDYCMQVRAVRVVVEEEMTRKRGELRQKKKVGLSCCLMAGIFTVIIFV